MHAQCKSALTHRIYVQLCSNYSLLGTRQIGVKYEQERKEALHFLYVSHRNMLVLYINTMRICYLCLMLLNTFRLSSCSKVQHILKQVEGTLELQQARVQTYRQFSSLGGKPVYSWKKIKFTKVLLH